MKADNFNTLYINSKYALSMIMVGPDVASNRPTNFSESVREAFNEKNIVLSRVAALKNCA